MLEKMRGLPAAAGSNIDKLVTAQKDIIIEARDQQLSKDDPEYAPVVISFVQSRKAFSNARIARGFYSVLSMNPISCSIWGGGFW